MTWHMEKTCKCGQHIEIQYDTKEDEKGTTYSIHAIEGGKFQSGMFRNESIWPNYVYCKSCNRRHDLTKFKKAE